MVKPKKKPRPISKGSYQWVLRKGRMMGMALLLGCSLSINPQDVDDQEDGADDPICFEITLDDSPMGFSYQEELCDWKVGHP